VFVDPGCAAAIANPINFLPRVLPPGWVIPDQLYGLHPSCSEPDPDQFMKNAWKKAAVVPIVPMIIPINSRSCPDLQPDHWRKVSPPPLGLWVIMGYIGYLVLFHPKKKRA
tara:strand:- start:112 stop:444 length:333 start_codon:yes stop_codon:yes gene_type:complete